MDNPLVPIVSAAMVRQAVAGITSSIADSLKETWKKNSPNLYKLANESLEKHSTTKTILYKNQSVPLSSLYVGTDFHCCQNETSHTQDDILTQINGGAKLLITASAGSGKSFFSKFAFIASLASTDNIPFFLELRHLNDSKLGILEHIARSARNHGATVTADDVYSWVKNANVTLFLDGYDELSKEASTRISDELRMLVDPGFAVRAGIVITSRPSEDIEYLNGVRTLRVKTLTKEKAIDLLERLDYDEDVKKKFLTELKDGLFEKHSDFLSNPLLLTIMLLTYGDIAEIPSKIHLFYEQAFDALFYRHDSSKGLFRRKLESQLASDDFKNILSCVAASGYIRNKVSYSRSELSRYIGKAKKIHPSRKFNTDKYISDLLTGVNLMLLEGREYKFNHRSFQEYFTALFLTQAPVPNKIDIFQEILPLGTWENVIPMSLEMNRGVVEKEFFLPMLNTVISAHEQSEESVFSLWMNGMTFQWIKLANNVKHPRYRVDGGTLHWDFLMLIERLYENTPGLPKAKVKRLLTKKAFSSTFGSSSFEKSVSFHPFSKETKRILTKLGVMEHARRRMAFLKLVQQKLNARYKTAPTGSTMSWL